MQEVHVLLNKYLDRFDIAPEFTQEEIKYWFMPENKGGRDQVIWSYVVEVSHSMCLDYTCYGWGLTLH